MQKLSMAQFEEVVVAVLEELPDDLRAEIDNLVVCVENEPTVDQLREVGLDPEEDTLFGLYEGTPITAREPSQFGGALPDQITIFRRPLLEECRSREELLKEIRDTVIHELGHYFGFGEEDLP